MPLTTKLINGKHRLVEASTGKISMTSNGNPRDGGGGMLKSKVQRQANAINAAIAKKGKNK